MTKKDWPVLRQYGRTMLSVQLFEQALRGLAVQASPALSDEELDFEAAWAEVAPLLEGKVPSKKLAGKVGADAELREEIETAVNTRNTLAHDYLLLYRMRAVLESRPPEDAVRELATIARKFEAVTERLEVLEAEVQGELGVEAYDEAALSLEEARRLWREATEPEGD